MAIAFNNAGTRNESAGATSITISMPASISAGDIIFGTVVTVASVSHVWPATYTVIDQRFQSTNLAASVAYRKATGSDTVPIVSWATSQSVGAVLWLYKGASLGANPIGNFTNATGTGSPNTCPSIATSRDNSVVMYVDNCKTAVSIGTPTQGGTWTNHINAGSTTSRTQTGESDIPITTSGTATGSVTVAGGASFWVGWQIELLAPLTTGKTISAGQGQSAKISRVAGKVVILPTSTVLLKDPIVTGWTVPAGVTTLTSVECWGAGGQGSNFWGTPKGAGGGAYAATYTFAVTPLSVISCSIGLGGFSPSTLSSNSIGVSGGDTWFSSTSTVFAQGGSGGHGGVSNAPGGSAGSSIGVVVFGGGRGGASTSGAAGGGGCGGPDGAGIAGGDITTGNADGGAGDNGLGGAAGVHNDTGPNNSTIGGSSVLGGGGGSGVGGSGDRGFMYGVGGLPGGGGGGNNVGPTGPAGGNGQIRITYLTVPEASLDVINSVGKIIDSTDGLTQSSFINLDNTVGKNILVKVGKFVSIVASFVAGGGGTSNPLTITVLSAQHHSLLKMVGKFVSLSGGQKLLLTNSIGKTIIVLSNNLLLLLRQVVKAVFIAQGSALSLLKQIGKIELIFTGEVLQLVKQISKILLISKAMVITLIRQIGKVVSIFSASSLVLTMGKAFLRTLNVITGSVVTLSRSLTLGKIIVILQGSSVSVIRSVGKLITAGQGQKLLLSRQVAKTIIVDLSNVLLVQAIKVFLRAINIATSHSVVLSRQAGKFVLVSLANAVTLIKTDNKIVNVLSGQASVVVRSIGKNIRVLSAENLTLVIGRALSHLASITTNSVLTTSRQTAKIIVISQAQSLLLSNQISKFLTLKASQAVTLIKSVGKNIQSRTNSVVTFVSGKAILRNFSIASGQVLNHIFSIGKVISTSTDHSFTSIKNIVKVIVVTPTNRLLNPSMSGAVVSGSLPTGWTNPAFSGLTLTVAAVGTEFGLSYVDFLISGTPGLTGGFQLNIAQMAAVQNQTWTFTVPLRIVGGDFTNFVNIALQISERTSGGALLNFGQSTFSPTVNYASYAVSYKLPDPTAGGIIEKIQWNVTSGAAVNATFRVYQQTLTNDTSVVSVQKQFNKRVSTSTGMVVITNAIRAAGILISIGQGMALSMLRQISKSITFHTDNLIVLSKTYSERITISASENVTLFQQVGGTIFPRNVSIVQALRVSALARFIRFIRGLVLTNESILVSPVVYESLTQASGLNETLFSSDVSSESLI